MSTSRGVKHCIFFNEDDLDHTPVVLEEQSIIFNGLNVYQIHTIYLLGPPNLEKSFVK